MLYFIKNPFKNQLLQDLLPEQEDTQTERMTAEIIFKDKYHRLENNLQG